KVFLQAADLDPTDLSTQAAILDVMQQMDKPAAQLVERAKKLLDQHPGDPRFALLMSIAEDRAKDREGAVKWALAASTRPAADAATALSITAHLDALDRYPDTVDYLGRAAKQLAGTDLTRLLTRRLREHARFAEV